MGLSGEHSFLSKPSVWAVLVIVASLGLNTYTLAPTVTLVDSGELIVAAHSLGVAHPPGFPLYVMLAHVAALVPIGSVAQRVNFASALFAALACGLLTLVVAELLKIGETPAAIDRAGRKQKTSSRRWASHPRSESTPLAVLPSAAAAGLLFACSRTLWGYATIAEVYTLNSLLILIVVLLMLRWRRQRRDRILYLAAAAFGAAMGVHHVTVALALPALAAIVYQTEGAKFFRGRKFIIVALCAIAGLFVVYTYLPFAAAREPTLNWGNPRSLSAIWGHVTGRQYQVFLSFSPENIRAQLPQFSALLLREFGPAWVPLTLCLAVSGMVAAFRVDRTTFLFLFLLALADVCYVLNYDIAEDKDAYYLPTFMAVAIAAGIGIQRLPQILKQTVRLRGASIIAAVSLLVLALALISNWRFNNRRHYFIAHDYAENILNSIESNGLILTLDWQVASPMLYTREIEQRRRDIKAIDVQLLRRSWYFDYLQRSYPDLIERSRDKVEAYVAELKKWEQDPELYARNTVLTQRIEDAFQLMLQSFVNRELETAPVYVTAELILSKEDQNINFIEWLTHNFQAVPRGLVFQLTRDNEFHDPGELQLQTRGLIDGTIRFADDDVVKLKILPIYKVMLQSRGQYLAHFHQPERANAAFEKAKRFE